MSAAENYVMSPLLVRNTLPGDTWLMLPTVRQADIDELAAMGATPEQCLRFGIQHSSECVTVFLYGEPAGVVGIIDYHEYRLPWAVLTTAIDRHPLPFLRGARAWMQRVQGHLVNFVDARNTVTIRWLQWLGFTLDEPEPHGINAELFHKFWKLA
jgi:hypothetical protein